MKLFEKEDMKMIEPKSITIENLENLNIIYIRFRGSYAI